MRYEQSIQLSDCDRDARAESCLKLSLKDSTSLAQGLHSLWYTLVMPQDLQPVKLKREWFPCRTYILPKAYSKKLRLFWLGAAPGLPAIVSG